MAFSPSFTAVQPEGEPSVITFADTSTGSDGAITQRRIYLRKPDATFLVPVGTDTDYVAWLLANTSINVDALDKDYALQLVVEWLDVLNNVRYSATLDRGFTQYNESYDYGLTQLLTANPLLSDDNGFREHKSDLRDFIDSGNQALEQATDFYNAQRCYDLATGIRLSSQYLFNADNNQ